MADNTLVTKILLLNGVKEDYDKAAAKNWVLAKGEPAVEFVPGAATSGSDALTAVRLKIGDGFTSYPDLPYVGADLAAEVKAELLAKFDGLDAEFDAVVARVGKLETEVADLKTTVSTLGNAVFEIEGAALDLIAGATEADKIVGYILANNGDVVVKEGNIAIVRRVINETAGKYSYTAYAFNGENWAAMDGNYDAENVYFKTDLLTTTAVGNISLTGGQATISAAGKNLVDVFNTIYVKEDSSSLKTSSPTAALSSTTTTYYEIGTTGTKDITVSMNSDGEYKFGYTTQVLNEGDTATAIINDKTTGVKVKSTKPYQLYLAGTEIEPKTENGATFTLSPEKKDAMGSMNLYGVVNYDEGGIPVSNLKKAYPSQRIGASSVRTHASGKELTTFAWYIPFFQGFSIEANNNVVVDHANITETQLKALTAPVSGSTSTATKVTGANAYSKQKLTTAVAPSAWRQYYIAYPKDWGYDMSGAKDGNNIDCTVNEAADITMNINGNDVVYKVYYINNGTPYATTKITWTLS